MTTCRTWKLKAIKKAAKSYFFENGSRDYHLDNNGLSVDSIYDKIEAFVNE